MVFINTTNCVYLRICTAIETLGSAYTRKLPWRNQVRQDGQVYAVAGAPVRLAAAHILREESQRQNDERLPG